MAVILLLMDFLKQRVAEQSCKDIFYTENLVLEGAMEDSHGYSLVLPTPTELIL